jgi:hypothetical protein
MMSGVLLETCWAFNERWNNKFYYKVASSWLFLLSHTAMHGSMNIKKTNPLFLPENKPADHPACHLDTTLPQLSQLTAHWITGTLLGFYAAQNASFLQNISDPIFKGEWLLKIGPMGCPKTSTTNQHSVLCKSQSNADNIYTAHEARNYSYWKKFLIFGSDILLRHTKCTDKR